MSSSIKTLIIIQGLLPHQKKHSFLSSVAGLDQDEERNTEYLGVNSLFDSKISDRGCSTALEILCNVIPKA